MRTLGEVGIGAPLYAAMFDIEFTAPEVVTVDSLLYLYLAGYIVTLGWLACRHNTGMSSLTSADDGGTRVADNLFAAALDTTAAGYVRAISWPLMLGHRLYITLLRAGRRRRLERDDTLFLHPILQQLARRLHRNPRAYRNPLARIDPALVTLLQRLQDQWITATIAPHRGRVDDLHAGAVDLARGLALHLRFHQTAAITQPGESGRNRLRRDLALEVPYETQHTSSVLADVTAGIVHGWLDHVRYDRAYQFLRIRLIGHSLEVDALFARIARTEIPAGDALGTRRGEVAS